jgi:hypothetical protein
MSTPVVALEDSTVLYERVLTIRTVQLVLCSSTVLFKCLGSASPSITLLWTVLPLRCTTSSRNYRL